MSAKIYRSGTVQAVQTTVADVSYEESAPTNGRGDSPRENKGNKRNKGKRRGVQNLNLLCQITDFLLRLFRNGEPHGGGLCFFCWEEQDVSIEKECRSSRIQ